MSAAWLGRLASIASIGAALVSSLPDNLPSSPVDVPSTPVGTWSTAAAPTPVVCPPLVCNDPNAVECVVSAAVQFPCVGSDLYCVWESANDVVLATTVGTMSSQPTCRVHLTWHVNGLFHMTSNSSVSMTSFQLTALDLFMDDTSLFVIEETLAVNASRKFRLDQDATIISGGSWPGHSGGRVNITTSSFVLHGEIRASGGEGICIDGKCTPGGNGGFVTLLYTSVATETGSIVVSGGANPLNSDPHANVHAVDDDDDVLWTANCLSGAAGQVLRIFASNKGTDGYLVISNGFNGPSSNVRRCAPVVFNTGSIDPSVKRVLIEGESLVRFDGTTWGMHGDSELIVEDATLVGVAAAPLHVFVKQLVVRGTSILHSSAGLYVTADILSIDFGAKVTWGPQASSKFVASDGVQINGNVSTTSTNGGGTFVIQSGGNLVVDGTISTPTLFAASTINMVVTGVIQTNAQTAVDSAQYPPCSQLVGADPATLNYTLMLTSQGSIDLGQQTKPSLLSGSSILLCSNQSIRVGHKSVVSATGLGYPATRGLGAGDCTDGSGGGGGYGGDGADSVEIQSGHVDVVHSDGGLSYGSRSSTGYLGSGGGCFGGGTGGGLVMLGAYRVELNGSILANGQNGVAARAGGGSGGYIGLTILNGIVGTGYLSASGGNASCSQDAYRSSANATTWTCGGGGGGGRLRLLGCENFNDCTTNFSGTYSVMGGKADKETARASIGTYFGFPCPPGYGGLMCRVCDKGSFKQERGSSECLVCKNSPVNAHYTHNGSTSSECLWSCDPGYTGIHCLSPLDDFFDMFGGKLVFFVVAFGALVSIVVAGYLCKKDLYTPDKSSSNVLEKDHLLAKRPWYKHRLSRMIWPRVGYPKLQENELKIHMARIYLSGNNTQENPLRLHADVPRGLDLVLDKDKFKNLAEHVNSILAFSTGGSMLFNLTKMLCYPLASDVMFYRRHKKFNALKRWMSKYNHECMLGARSRSMANALKLGYCADYSLAYIELLYVENNPSSCIPRPPGIVGKPHLPLVLLFAGLGTYESPLYLDPNDLLVRSVPQSPELTAFIDEAWIEIIADLNAMLRVVNVQHASHSLRDLMRVSRFCEQKNGHHMRSQRAPSLGGLRMHLGRFFTGGKDQRYQWGLFLTCVHIQKSVQVAPSLSASSTIGIREQALLENPNVWSPTKPPSSGCRMSSGWNAPIDEMLPIPGILVNTDALEERQNHVQTRNQLVCHMHRVVVPSNVMKATMVTRSWILYMTIAVAVFLDLATTLGMLVNLKCVENGMEMRSCTNGVLWPVLLVYPFAIIVSPICGIVTLTTSSPTFARKYGLWNACSVVNVAVAIVICYIESDKLVAPYVTRPLPLFPCATLVVKVVQAVVVDYFIADMEATRRRRGWRGLMKRRDSDSSTPPASPYHSPRLNEAIPFKETEARRGSSHYGTVESNSFVVR
ncbi:hypothetical protein H310_11479 [Aphanomyces invadans]|uniref:DUF8003 domain-containing protein n=1 Tax=Aphanomyces invadans TaxID=157072 RepID=A0A024TKY8_9STRA|nr:hypothetical protein H310_11479 [Aphanomyces invadans]ETV94805.1 hypothetical protein H310_11479 [Aphanomyces invadans]|eukprot:XP_008876396.1 hypothetical protein H310_11479 [Aphanomyces invadans]